MTEPPPDRSGRDRTVKHRRVETGLADADRPITQAQLSDPEYGEQRDGQVLHGVEDKECEQDTPKRPTQEIGTQERLPLGTRQVTKAARPSGGIRAGPGTG